MTGRPHGVTSETLQRILLHGDERAPASPAGIALRMGEILRCDHYITNRRLRPAGKNTTDLQSARGWWRSNYQGAVGPDRGQNIPIVRGKDKEIRCDLGDTHWVLSETRGLAQRSKRQEQDRYAKASITSLRVHRTDYTEGLRARRCPLGGTTWAERPLSRCMPGASLQCRSAPRRKSAGWDYESRKRRCSWFLLCGSCRYTWSLSPGRGLARAARIIGSGGCESGFLATAGSRAQITGRMLG